VHAHADSEHLAFSRPDLESGRLVVEFLARRLPGRIHGLLVLGPNGQVRSLLAGGSARELHEVRIGADPLGTLPPRRAASAPGRAVETTMNKTGNCSPSAPRAWQPLAC
jgi:hypothetical protein